MLGFKRYKNIVQVHCISKERTLWEPSQINTLLQTVCYYIRHSTRGAHREEEDI